MKAETVFAALVGLSLAVGCSGSTSREVVVYTSLDQRFSEPVLQAFEDETGIRTRVVYDTEATKTTGLVNRLLAERGSPRADVFWNSEIVRTIVLKRANVLVPYRSPAADPIPGRYKDPDGYWTGFAARARVIIVNTELLPESQWPRQLDDLTDPRWRDRVGMAYPLFGTTSTHVAALFARWGSDEARAWLEAMKKNGVVIVDGNSTARDMVVAGRVPVALTDTDDVAVALTRNRPVAMIFPDSGAGGTLVIPNTVSLIRGGPHPDEGRTLIDYLLSPEVERRLAAAEGAQIPLRSGLPWPAQLPPRETLRPMDVNYDALADQLEDAVSTCRDLFVR